VTPGANPNGIVEAQILLTQRCRECVTDRHEVCDGSRELVGGLGRTHCECYCLDLLEDDEHNALP
jgi:hypothetical protein